ncbi:MAG: sodium/solute symporter [bacterium]|nr:sodium/solute symporter [bacterium]
MNELDWIVLAVYIIVLMGMSFVIGRGQQDQDDYYLGGRSIAPWQVGISMAANQVSAISLIGVPAFIAIKQNGGLTWLQYELAVPLAMIGIIVFLVPLFRSGSGVTIYEYLENRFGAATRLTLSMVFLVSRSLATGVALLAASYVTSVCITGADSGTPFIITIIVIGAISLLYTALGGIKADIYSDIMQLILLWVSSFVVIGIIYNLLGGDISFAASSADSSARLTVFDAASTGFGDGNNYALWPMLIGGFFLYISYYGCDQSQAQRLLATSDTRGAQKALLINAFTRFPLVLTYSCIGILLILFLQHAPEFAAKISNKKPNFLLPYFFRDYVPAGLLGLMIAGIFAASMSSLDSAINSLSAATWEDFLIRIAPGLKDLPGKKKIRYSRVITLIWGGAATGFAVFMADGSDTVVELVNKIGSAFYGPIAGVFLLGILLKREGQTAPLAGLFSGVGVNIFLWIGFKPVMSWLGFESEFEVSWLWWNLIGFGVTLVVGTLAGLIFGLKQTRQSPPGTEPGFRFSGLVRSAPQGMVMALIAWFVLIVGICVLIEMRL